MSHHDNRATLERMVTALYAGRVDEAATAIAEDAVVEWPQSGERMVGKQACTMVYKNYPGGSPAYQLRRIRGGGDLFVLEATGRYGADTVYTTSIVEFRDGLIAKQTDYFANPFEAPAWRSQWIERMEPV
jgi:hypothetical protein